MQFSSVKTYKLTYKLIYLHKLFFINSKIGQYKEALKPSTNQSNFGTDMSFLKIVFF